MSTVQVSRIEHQLLPDLSEKDELRILNSKHWPRRPFIEVAKILNLTQPIRLAANDTQKLQRVKAKFLSVEGLQQDLFSSSIISEKRKFQAAISYSNAYSSILKYPKAEVV